MKKNPISEIIIFLLILTFTTGCATTGGGKKPEWVLTPPADTDESVYFVGVGSDNKGNSAAANEQASKELLAEITRFLGVKVTSQTSIEAKDIYGKFESNIIQNIKEKSSAQIADFRVVDTWTETVKGIVNVYILGEYNKAALLKEKTRLEAVFTEKVEAISGPEAEGDRFIDSGSYYKAAKRYIEAALASSTSEIDNAAIKFERNINKAKGAAGKINLIPLTNNIEGFLNEPLNQDFLLKVTGGSSSDAAGLSGVDIRVNYKVMKSSGRMSIKYLNLQSDENGVVSFTRPVPEFVGRETVTMSLNLRSAIEPLEDLQDEFFQHVEGLQQIINEKRVNFNYEVISKAKEIPTCILIIDVDRSGNPISKSDTASGVLEVLTKADFDVASIPVDYRFLNINDSEIIRIISDMYKNRFERVIFGIVEISSFDENDGSFIIKVDGNIKAANLSDGKILFSGTESKRARGNNESSTMAAAFKSVGKEFGKLLINNLP